MTVTDNKTPGKAPEGYVFLDPVSYIVSFKDADMSNVTIQEMNYEFDPKSTIALPLHLPSGHDKPER